jgi:tetratricopeptide (TPR) repeat protein
VAVFEVTGLGPLRTRLQVAARRGLTKFVGREPELEQMKHALGLVRQGHGQIVAAMGEPGVGKSRLIFEFKAVAQSGCLVLEAYSVSHGKASAYLPVIDLLHSYFGVISGDDTRGRREKVGGKVLMLDRNLEDTLPYLFALLGIVEGDDPLAQMDGQRKKRRTLEAIKRILLRESLSQPLIVIFEDLHWIDEQTQEFLNLFTDSIGTARILLLVNYRPEYQHQWGSKTYYTQLRLDPLGKESAEEMLDALLAAPAPPHLAADASRQRPPANMPVGEQVSAGLPLPDQGEGRGVGIDALKRIIIERTEGVPFFMEEMVQALYEDGALARNGTLRLTRPLDALRIPATVQAVLASRIDRLPAPEKKLLQTLAVLGRDFALGLVRVVTRRSTNELERMLWRLHAGEFIYEQPAAGDVEYIFKHALTQEVAYNALLAERRKLLHERAGAALESLFANQLDDHLAELAHHYSRSDNVSKAVEYLGRAGARAAQHLALSEAVGYLKRELELLKRLPPGVNRDRQELDLLILLGGPLYYARGPAAYGEAEAMLLRARELCEQLGDEAKLITVGMMLTTVYISRNELPRARELAQQNLALAERTDPGQRGANHALLGGVLYLMGDFDSARAHFARALEFPDAKPGPNGELASTPSPTVSLLLGNRAAAHAELASTLLPTVSLLLGYPAAACREGSESLASDRHLSDPVTLARALVNDAMRHALLRDSRTTMERADEALSIAMEHALPFYQGRASFYRGLAMVAAGQAEEGMGEMRRCLSAFASAGSLVPLFAAMLADCYGRNGQTEEGLATVGEALARSEQRGEKMAEAELYRVKGELLMRRDPPDEVQARRCIDTAIDIARRQKARW